MIKKIELDYVKEEEAREDHVAHGEARPGCSRRGRDRFGKEIGQRDREERPGTEGEEVPKAARHPKRKGATEERRRERESANGDEGPTHREPALVPADDVLGPEQFFVGANDRPDRR